jgi:Cu-Zn family superoxide dismutase
MSMCAHYTNHGGPLSKERHVGDLGNVKANAKGDVHTFYDCIRLRGIKCGLILHENEESLRGKRIACAVIGYAKENYTKRIS